VSASYLLIFILRKFDSIRYSITRVGQWGDDDDDDAEVHYHSHMSHCGFVSVSSSSVVKLPLNSLDNLIWS
jgi:hypothetical protein